jgi:hypothetical protein
MQQSVLGAKWAGDSKQSASSNLLQLSNQPNTPCCFGNSDKPENFCYPDSSCLSPDKRKVLDIFSQQRDARRNTLLVPAASI